MTPVRPLGELVDFKSGGTPSKSNPDYFMGEIPWITGADIDDNGQVAPRSYITPTAIANSATNMVPAGTVLLVTRTSVGKTAITPSPLTFSQDITALQSQPGILDHDYLRHFLRASASELARRARGATIKGVTRDVVASLEIPVPPLVEQSRIAKTLNHADMLRAKRRQALSSLDELARSTFIDIFVKPSTRYPLVTVETLTSTRNNSIRTGPFGSQLLHSEFVDAGIPVLGIDNVVHNEFRWGKARFITPEKYKKLSRYRVFPGDVLITIMGTCGRCAIAPDNIFEAITTKHLCCITLDQQKCLPEFLQSYFLIHPEARSYLERTAKGAIMSGLNMGIIKAMPVAVPPIAEQERYRDTQRLMRDQKENQDIQSRQLDELFASLQAKAFSGEL